RSDTLLNYLLTLAANQRLSGSDIDSIAARLADEAARFVNERIDRSDGHPFTDQDVEDVVGWCARKISEGRNFKAVSPKDRQRKWLRMLEGNADAYTLLEYLARCHLPSKHFAVCIPAMFRDECLPCWSKSRLKKARKRL